MCDEEPEEVRSLVEQEETYARRQDLDQNYLPLDHRTPIILGRLEP